MAKWRQEHELGDPYNPFTIDVFITVILKIWLYSAKSIFFSQTLCSIFSCACNGWLQARMSRSFEKSAAAASQENIGPPAGQKIPN